MWSITIIFGFLGLWITLANWQIIWNWHKHGKRSSLIPLLGGIFLYVAIKNIPNNPYQFLKWAVFIVDRGSLPLIIHTIIFYATGKHKKTNERYDDTETE